MMKSFTVIIVLLFISNVASGFVIPQGKTGISTPCTSSTTSTKSSSLQMSSSFQEDVKKVAASVVAASLIVGSVVGVAPSPAFGSNTNDNNIFLDNSGSQIILAARSGGRMGGRAMRSSSYSRGGPSYRSNTRIINRNTYVRPGYGGGGVMVAPSPVYGGYGYGYNPFGGLGLGLGLNAVGNIGNDIRDYRQEGEIQDTRLELEKSRIREAELESRLKALEQGQSGLQQQQNLQQIQQQQQNLQLQQQQQQAPAK